MPDTRDAIWRALQKVPQFSGKSPDSYSATRLGGLTNLVYQIQTPDENLILRIPGAGTNDYIDRKVELHNARAAARAGISADVIWADGDTGIMISQFLNETVTMTPKLFASRSGAAARAGAVLARLHHSGEVFRFRFELFQMIDNYMAILSDRAAKLPAGYREIVDAAAPIKVSVVRVFGSRGRVI